jgi:hypothetical protein
LGPKESPVGPGDRGSRGAGRRRDLDVAGRATDQARGDATCRSVLDKASEYGSSVEFFRAQQSTAGAVARWQEERHAPEVTGLVSPLRGRDPGESVTICLFSGSFVTPHPPGLPDHDMLRLLVLADGSVVLDSAGYRGVIDREAPAE